MRNIIRALRYTWPYRYRLLLSIFSALMVAVFWSINLSAILPVLKILSDDQSMHSWVTGAIAGEEAKVREKTDELEKTQVELAKIESKPDAANFEQQKQKALYHQAELQSRLNDHSTALYRYQLLQARVIRFMPENRFETFVWIMGAVVLGVLFKGFFDFWQEALVGNVVNRTLFDLRNDFYRTTIHQDMKQLAESGTTELMSRFTNDMEQLGQGLKTLYGRMVVEPLKAAGCLVAACIISWQLTLVFIVLVPLALVTLTKLSRMMRKAARKLLEQMSDIYKILRETFDGIRVVKAFTMESYERARFRKATNNYARNAQRVANIDAFAGPMVELFGVIAMGLALTAGAYLVLEKQRRIFGLNMSGEQPLTFQTLLLLYAYLAAVADPVRKLSSVYTKMQAGEAAAERIFALYDKTPSVKANADGTMLDRHAKQIEFKNVCFSWTPGSETLSSVHLTVKAGETIAFVGPNGCGKTTLLGLLPRFYDPDHGSVLIDGVNLRGAGLRSLRRQVGLVTQQTVMFEDTVFNNIAYGHHEASIEAVQAAAKKAFAHEFVVTLPKGYDTIIGDGWKPSGGQEQRLALARAILRDPSILILDEFTSQIDPESEAKIHMAIKDFVKGRTTFLITHRLSTLEIADRIVVMEAGRIVAVGSHELLMRDCGLYQRLYDAQLQYKEERIAA
ncbi:ABC transporter ATP-binding protein [soil metagenome]